LGNNWRQLVFSRQAETSNRVSDITYRIGWPDQPKPAISLPDSNNL
jgi:hypothetical protein